VSLNAGLSVLRTAAGCIGNNILDAPQRHVFFKGVNYSVCAFSKNQIDKAGRKLSHPKASYESTDIENAIEVINSFRAAHNFPLLIFRIDLATRARKIDVTATVAQRLKRLPSIEAKLRRLSTRLTQMEDIGGCRAVVSTCRMVRRLSNLYKKSRMKHQRLHVVDYLKEPRDTGYRGVHLIYAYHSNSKPEYNGLKIEIQLRSRSQHAWATAVETVDAFMGQGLKDGSGNGDPKWQRFFALMGTYIAKKDGGNPVPNTPTDWQLLNNEISSLANELEVIEHLESYRATLNSEGIRGARFYLVELDAPKNETRILGFKEDQFEEAQKIYVTMEKELADQPGRDVVLVSVGSLESLKRAYPNYFADTDVFIEIMSEAIMSSDGADIAYES
jgi:Region found in RelA / SpoT proteins